MSQLLLDVLPDLTVGTIEIRDIANLVVGSLGVILAVIAIRMGREQTRIAREQTAIAKRQEALETEQARIAQRQAEIAETQHEIMLEQQAKRAELSLELWRDGPIGHWQVSILNRGTKTAEQAYWHLLIPKEQSHLINIIPLSSEPLREDSEAVVVDGISYLRIATLMRKPIFPNRSGICAKLTIEPTFDLAYSDPAMRTIKFLWWISAEDGVFPANRQHALLALPYDTQDQVVRANEL